MDWFDNLAAARRKSRNEQMIPPGACSGCEGKSDILKWYGIGSSTECGINDAAR